MTTLSIFMMILIPCAFLRSLVPPGLIYTRANRGELAIGSDADCAPADGSSDAPAGSATVLFYSALLPRDSSTHSSRLCSATLIRMWSASAQWRKDRSKWSLRIVPALRLPNSRLRFGFVGSL